VEKSTTCPLHPTPAPLLPEKAALLFGGVDVLGLDGGAGGEGGGEGAAVPVATALHLGDELVVPQEEGFALAAPAARLRVVGEPRLPLRQDRPERVQLTVLAEKMLAAEALGREIPNAHGLRPIEPLLAGCCGNDRTMDRCAPALRLTQPLSRRAYAFRAEAQK